MDSLEWLLTAVRPRVKPELLTQKLVDGRVRIGGVTYMVAGCINDPTGIVWTLVQSLDGTRRLEEVIVAVREAHPGVGEAKVRADIAVLAEAGYLDDADEQPPKTLSQREIQRYAPSRCFYRWVDPHPRNSWDPQLRLRDAAVTLVGVGGIGSTAALALACSGVGRLHCVDPDVVELSNLNRQILYDEGDVGRTKVDAAVQRLRAYNSDITVTGEVFGITCEDDYAKLVADCDLLLVAADGPADCRELANRACLAADTPWIDSSYFGPACFAILFVPGQGPCYECALRHHGEKMLQLGSDEAIPPCDLINPVTAPVAMMSGQLMAQMALAWITQSMPVVPGQLRGVDLLAADHNYVTDYHRDPDCSVCG
jgi:molybdopterin/thiamine biosynthesis adenylyltransferase